MSSYFYISEEIIPYLIRNAISFMYGHSGENLERIILIFQMKIKIMLYRYIVISHIDFENQTTMNLIWLKQSSFF